MASTEPASTEIQEGEPAKVFAMSEIEKHTTRDDLWMVINGKVYDVTPFIDEHP